VPSASVERARGRARRVDAELTETCVLENGETLRLDSCDDSHDDEVDAGNDGNGVGVWSKEEGASGEEERDVGEREKSNSSFRDAKSSDDESEHCEKKKERRVSLYFY